MFKKGIVTAAVVVLSVAAGGTVLASVGSFDPNGKPPTKGFVAVEAYKWLRDNAPAAIAGCEKTVDQFDDLHQQGISKFKREAINCLASIGFFDNYPAASPTPRLGQDIGAWAYFEGTNIDGDFEGYWTAATSSTAENWQLEPELFLRCDENGSFAVFVATPWSLYNNYADTDSMAVDYRFSEESGVTRTLAFSDKGSESNVWLYDFSVGDGDTLYVLFIDSYSQETANFDVTGISDVMAVLPCA